MAALVDLMVILWMLLDYLCEKDVLDEAFDYTPHNDAPVLAQPSPEGGEKCGRKCDS